MNQKIILILILLVVFLCGCVLTFTEGTYYYIKSIPTYNSENINTPTDIVVWERGISGATKKISCIFPPEFELEGDDDIGWHIVGQEEIKTIKEYRDSVSAKNYYLCEEPIRP